jgi:hypothetical protein
MRALTAAGLLAQLPPPGGASRGGGAAARRATREPPTPLPFVFDAATFSALAREHEDVRAALLPLLPPGQQTLGDLDVIVSGTNVVGCRQAMLVVRALGADRRSTGQVRPRRAP